MLPFSLSAALMSVISGQITSRSGRWRPIVWIAYAIMTLGFGLMTMLDDHSNIAERVLYPFVAAIGVGCLFQVILVFADLRWIVH